MTEKDVWWPCPDWCTQGLFLLLSKSAHKPLAARIWYMQGQNVRRQRSLGQAIFGASVTKCVGTRGLKILGSKSYNSWSGKCRVPEAVVTKMSLYEIDLLIPTAPLKILLLCEKPLQILSPTSPTPTYSPPTNSSLYPALVLLIFWIYFMMTFAHGNAEEAAVGCTVPFLSWVFIF